MITEDLQKLGLIEAEMAAERREYRRKVKPLRNEKRLLEASIAAEVLKAGKTIQVGNMRAEYRPTVVIEMIKEKEQE